MNPEQENFEALQRLLKLKRHEQPPPRYFNDFSTQVIRRIQTSTAEDRATFWELLLAEAPWLRRLFGVFEAKPAVAWSFGLAACALVVSGIVLSETVETTPMASAPAPAIHSPNSDAPLMALGQTPNESVNAFAASTDPIAQPVGSSLFDLVQPPSVQPVSREFGR